MRKSTIPAAATDKLLPIQQIPMIHPFPGEIRLMSAILVDAIHAFWSTRHSSTPNARRAHREARKWLFSRDRQWCFSFLNICDSLSISPEWLRGQLLDWQIRELEAKKPAKPAVPAKSLASAA